MKTPICDFINEYAKSDALRLHMPGHKGKSQLGFEALDITEITGADSLYHADGIIKESEENEAAEEKTLSPQEAWDAGVKKAEDFILKSLEYDDEDPISLDNMGQFIYRVKGDKEGAKTWFEKAIALKDKQIDTLYFLSRYDVETGDKEAAIEKLEKAAKGNFSPLNYCSRETVLKEIEKLKGAN